MPATFVAFRATSIWSAQTCLRFKRGDVSPRFREAYGEYVNAQMHVRAALQREVEQACGQLGMPTRTEVDAAHRKIVQLEREVRRMRDQLQRQADPAPTPPAAGSDDAAPKPRAAAAKSTKGKSSSKGSAR